ncbi:PAS domain containing protein [Sulfitobacter noctilucae]|uniref:PAS domain-containing protein n=1 Tax=Sulfitobacter noctilucae TaxID=1342302 RepID=UPI000469790A|nr:PAS domain-containing protein [Sulfitobacter noctilucae]KIN70977.1 PAS domain containing protein [Sulfitobacter noctilucae]
MTERSKLDFGSLDATLDRAPYPLTLSDLDRDDQPLIYMNRAFRDMTGTTDAHLGQNCRFLQSDLENDAARAEIRLALEENRRTQVILKNRRMNGETFHNLLLLEPISNKLDSRRLALGAQFELARHELEEFKEEPVQENGFLSKNMTDTTLQLRLERRRVAANSAVQLVQSFITLDGLSKQNL